MKVLVVGGVGAGHIRPVRDLCGIFISQGHEVCLVQPLRVDIDQLLPLCDHVLCIKETVDCRDVHELMTYMDDPERSKRIYESVATEFGKPDIIIADIFASALGQSMAESWSVANYMFLPCSAVFLASFVAMLADPQNAVLCKSLDIPGLGHIEDPTTPFLHVPASHNVETFKQRATDLIKSNGVLVNDSVALYDDELEGLKTEVKRGVERVRSSVGFTTKTEYEVYCVGPLIDSNLPSLKTDQTSSKAEDDSKEDETIEWLDQQPPQSVIFVAFGSWCEIPPADMAELAYGLEQMVDYRILWSLRKPLGGENVVGEQREVSEDVDSTGLPQGFRERISERGRIVPWVDQPRVLAHPAVRLFVSHCGWNSLSESLRLQGKPIGLLPIGAEQVMNAAVLSQIWRVGINLWSQEDGKRLLKRSDVQRKLHELLASEDMAKSAVKMSDRQKRNRPAQEVARLVGSA